MADPINPKVTGATGGAALGFYAGKIITNVLVSFGVINADQGASVANLIEFVATVGLTFLGGYLRSN